MNLRESESVYCASCKVKTLSYKCVNDAGNIICCPCWLLKNKPSIKNKVDRLKNNVDRPIKHPNIGGYVWK